MLRSEISVQLYVLYISKMVPRALTYSMRHKNIANSISRIGSTSGSII